MKYELHHQIMSQTSSAFATAHATNTLWNRHIPTMPHRRSKHSPLNQFTTSASEFDKDYSQFQGDNDADAEARSQFGTKSYWDAMYEGMGDFAADEYSWYYGFEVVKPILQDYVLGEDSSGSTASQQLSILVPGCGNDPLLLDLFNAGYHTLSAFDYSSGAMDRQRELLEYLPMGSDLANVDLSVEDARSLPTQWEESFDVIIEKGALDAIYLSGDGNFEQSAKEFARVVKKGGICISCSGVVPEALRREGFGTEDWEWLRDGSDDLKAGCFVLKRR
mmetsp:Transcript_3110/g.6856  ORF Transcript_3110/g.6856 Transcript_3110/m.6856 type:complete len:277 (-) Transcript_3110:155-985(-)